MRIYTKTGDDGSTGLFGGARVDKDSPRVEAYGSVDELNTTLGLARLGAPTEIDSVLARVQDDLFCVGAELACVPGHESRLSSRRVGDAEAEALERAIDAAEAELPELRSFILPGGSRAGAALHHARAVCRRAERRLLALGRSESGPGPRPQAPTGPIVRPELVVYLNRLSDLLFVLARRANQLAGHPDTPWTPRTG